MSQSGVKKDSKALVVTPNAKGEEDSDASSDSFYSHDEEQPA